MLTTKDVNLLITAMKEFFYTKEDMDDKFDVMDQKFSNLQTSVDGIAKISKDNQQEILVMGHRLDQIEQRI